jgi:hypothetical protein
MYRDIGNILIGFEQGQYTTAVREALRIAEKDNDKLQNACKLFLKEFYPLMLSEDGSLFTFKSRIDSLLERFVPEKDCQDYRYLICGFGTAVKERYIRTQIPHWNDLCKTIRKILGMEECVIISDKPRVRPEPAADPEADLKGTAPESEDKYSLEILYADAEICFEGKTLSEKDDPFGCIIESFENGDYRKSVMQAVWIAKHSGTGEISAKAKLFLKEFFDFFLTYENNTADNFKNLVHFKKNIDSLLSGFDFDEESSVYLDVMRLFCNLTQTKYESTEKDYWLTVPSAFFESEETSEAVSEDCDDDSERFAPAESVLK